MNHVVDALLTLVRPLPGIFASDFGRYLFAAGSVTGILALTTIRFRQLRAVRARPPADRQRRREIAHSIVAAAVFASVGLGVYHGAVNGVLRVYDDVARLGGVYWGWTYWLTSLALIVVAHDAYFYWTHRLLHGRLLFWRVHRVHHESVAPTQWAAYSFSVGEALVQALFLPLFLLIVPTHASVIVVWIFHQVLRNAVGHCGVELEPKSWLAGWWGRWLTTTLHHDMHHACGRHNYGLYFTWWDRWCGTEHPRYRERLQRLIESVDAPAAVALAKEV